MTGRTILLIAAGIVFLFILSGCSHRHGGHARFSKNPEKHIYKIVKVMSRKLDLTDGQKVQVNELIQGLATDLSDIEKMKMELHNTIVDELGKEEVDVSALNGVIDNKAEQMNSLRYKVVDAFAEFHRMLTPQQRQKLVEKINKHDSRFRRMHH